ncbi:MAG: hypothetical protein AMXMBFR82_35100 [Candidatus Hydrogenedentota bacterium]
MTGSVDNEINEIRMNKPHVVILGAGASKAAFPSGDRNGKCVPLMNELVEAVELGGLLSEANVESPTCDFESMYDEMSSNDELRDIRERIDNSIYSYFCGLEFPDTPTLYDYLLLSLRKKDVVATFNWDPFLVHAYRRNAGKFDLPRLLFLHGNVAVGFCWADRVAGFHDTRCSKCGEPLARTRLLYPVSRKNYREDIFISEQWGELEKKLRSAFMITVFGYSAPESDLAAKDLMRTAWGNPDQRRMEQTEIIDVKSVQVLEKTWRPFICSHHYETHSSFFDSWIANHPRRTGEAYLNQYWEIRYIDKNPVPRNFSLPELWAWYERFTPAELVGEDG